MIRFAGALILLIAGPATTAEPLTACLERSPGAKESAQCYAQRQSDLERQQVRLLVKAWRGIPKMDSLGVDPKEAVQQLTAAQSNWKKFVTSDCAATTTLFGNGSGAALDHAQCMIRHYEERNLQLERIIKAYLPSNAP